MTLRGRVLIVVTGGTLAMDARGCAPLQPSAAARDIVKLVPELEEYAQIDLEVLCNLDSTLITPDHWLQLARRIEQVQIQASHRGVVVLHGTDTLAFSASALSFLLPALTLPVVFTGSQRPLAMTRSDARNNVLGAIEACLEGPCEVMAFFNQHAFRGSRVTKSSIQDFQAFSSPNEAPLGTVGIHWEWNEDLFWPVTRRPGVAPALPERLPAAPLVLPWVPGLEPEAILEMDWGQWGLVLEAFGTGNLPLSPRTAGALSAFIERGGLLAVRSQVPIGSTRLHTYQPGQALLELGIVPAGDMTREALVTKMMVLKGMGLQGKALVYQLRRPWVGEMDPS